MYRRVDEVREEIVTFQKKGDAEALHQIHERETFVRGQKVRN